MALANVLNAEPDVTCLHEGKFRDREVSGEQVLPYLTLENRLAYEQPGLAAELIARARSFMPSVGARFGRTHFGDIAYYYAPFVGALADLFPGARFIVTVRHPLNFVASAAGTGDVDPAPLGWPPEGRQLSTVEQFVGLGRLQPVAGTPAHREWCGWNYVLKNAWLWAETNRLILDQMAALPPERVFVARFESFFDDPLPSYVQLRTFLGLRGAVPDRIPELLAQPINRRPAKARLSAVWETLTSAERQTFVGIVDDVITRLHYTVPAASDGPPPQSVCDKLS